MASLVEALERRKQLSGLSNRELQELKSARRAEHDASPSSIAYQVRQREALQDQQQRQFMDHQNMQRTIEADRYHSDIMSRGGRGSGLIGQQNLRGGGGGGNQGIIGARSQDTPSEYIYRDLKSGEEYDPRTDVFFENEKGAIHRRKAVNPDYQEWVQRRAGEIAMEGMAKNAGTGQSAARPAPPEVLKIHNELLAARRDGTKDPVLVDEQLSALYRIHPELKGITGGTGGAGGATDVTAEQALQQLQEAGVPAEAAQKIIGQAAGQSRPKPTWDWQSEVTVGDRQSDAQARREFR